MQKSGEREQGTSLFRRTTVEFAFLLAVTHRVHLVAYRNVHLTVVPLPRIEFRHFWNFD